MTLRVSGRGVRSAGVAAAAALVLAVCTAGGASAEGLGAGPVGTAALGGAGQVSAQHLVPRTPAAPGISLTEGEVGQVGPRGTITYPSVTSCLVVTVHLRDGGKVGGHASLFQVPGKYASDEILPAIRRAVGLRPVKAVDVSGAVGAWNPSYFEKAIERYTDGAPPEPTGDARRIGDTVAELLGRPRAEVTVRDLPDGDITR
ncbi:hypothetical protein ACFWIQ_34915 [Kitasatospora sp. NPDC127059]|uniref:hypothetical protein n=1 Tax=unclassified Kitasatospora TaxID=2633591 RepID=UPI0036524B10